MDLFNRMINSRIEEQKANKKIEQFEERETKEKENVSDDEEEKEYKQYKQFKKELKSTRKPAARTRKNNIDAAIENNDNNATNDAENDEIFKIIQPRWLIMFAGSSESGKTHLMKYLLVNMLKNKVFQIGLIMSTTKFNDAFDFIEDKNLIISGYNENLLKKFLKKLKQLVESKRKFEAFLILDDLIGTIDLTSPLFKNLIATFRHYHLSIFLSTQWIYMGSRLLREQANCVFMYSQNTADSYKALYDSYGAGFENFADFKRHLDEITRERYWAMLYLKNEREKDKKYLAYKAPEHIANLKFRFSTQKKEDAAKQTNSNINDDND